MKVYLAGQYNFGNRGNEALVRSIFDIVHSRFPDAELLVPTADMQRDSGQWPGMSEARGRFVGAVTNVPVIRWWERLASRIPPVRQLWEPRFSLPTVVAEAIVECDVVLMIGGDIISLDYHPGSLFFWSGLMDAAHRAGKPTMLFAASVGPFTSNPVIERFMVNHLRRYSAISIRESASFSYVKRLGIDTAVLTADPAFCLTPEAVDLGPLYGPGKPGVLAFNVSPLVNESWVRAGNTGSLISECVAFIRRVLAETPLSLLLLPHVDPLDGSDWNSDSVFMRGLLMELGETDGRVELLRRGLNAAQLKYVISRSRYLIAARTHATIAGWSQCVPTASIAYSIKARGLNQDLFDSLDYVVETPKVSQYTLWEAYSRLAEREGDIKALLAKRIPTWRAKAMSNVDVLASVLP